MFKSVHDYIALTKPRITFFCLLMTLSGAFLVQGQISALALCMVLLGTACSVGAANAFNMIYEQDADKLMTRTCNRPLASGRLTTNNATIFAFVLGLSSLIVLSYFVNFLTALIALFAIVSYSLIYTPLKMKTPLALVIGAIPGAIAPLLGATAVQNKITLSAFVIFSILFVWQMPHFIAISIYSKLDYARAGFKVISVVRTEKTARIQAFLWTVVLLFVSLLLVPLQLAGNIYFVCAMSLGLWFLFISVQGLRDLQNKKWPRKFFLASLIYLPLLALSVIIDRVFTIG